MNRFENKLIADIVIDNINTSKIFKKHNIDYCVEGNSNIVNVCEKKNINIKKILDQLNAVNDNVYYLQNYDSWELSFLIHFLSEIHHDYKEENILLLKEYGQKVFDMYGAQFQELLEINNLIQSITEEVLEHMKNEETILFPYIEALIQLEKENVKVKSSDILKSRNIEDFEDDHSKIRAAFQKIKQVSNNYLIPENVCDSFKLLYIKLQKFDDELQDHIHIENNILLPKVKELEHKVFITDS